MPGIDIRTTTRSGPPNPGAAESGRYFVVGQFDRGPTDTPTRVRSMAEVEATFGSRVSYGSAWDDLRCFFEEGGAEAHVIRVVGPAATKGFLSLVDSVAAAGLRIEAVSAGAWSTGVKVQVTAGTAGGTFALVVDGPTATDTIRYDNLANPAAAAEALLTNPYVRGIPQGGGSPVVAAAAALSAGSDNRASITSAHMTGALTLFGANLGAGAVAIPGYACDVVGADVISWCKLTDRLYIGATAVGVDPAAAKADVADLITASGEYGLVAYPWVRVPVGGGATRLIGPEGYVAACRARVHQNVGPWAAAAGDVADARFITGVEREIDRTVGDDLDAAHISAIRRIGGRIRLYGYRSLSSDTENYRLLNGRDVLNTLVYAAEALLERHVFKTIDGRGLRLASVAADLIGLVDPYRAAGGLYERTDEEGRPVDRGYSVDVGPSVNTPGTLAAGKVAAVLAVRVSPIGELIDLNIVKAGLTATV